MGPGLYGLLGVSLDADGAEIRRAFHEAARVWHPDRNPGDASAEDRFKRLSAAYEILSDPERRADYDRELGRRGLTAGGLVEQVSERLGSLWEELMARGRLGRDLRYTLELSFEEAALGTRRVIDVPSLQGRREFTITVPPGARDGATTRVAGEGERPPDGGAPGDLHVVLRVRPHAVLVRQGADLLGELPIPLPLALAGGTAIVPTLEGTAEIVIRPGVAQGERLRLPGRGVPRRGGGRGDLWFSIFIEPPAFLTETARAHAVALGEALPAEAFPRMQRFLEVTRGRK